MDDLRNVVTHFRKSAAAPSRTILWGVSAGALAGAESMERFGSLYDGALLDCAPLAGATRTWDASADLLLAYDVVFGMPSTWGTMGDLRDDIDFETEVQPKLVGEISSPANFSRFAFLRLVNGLPGRGIATPPNFFPGWIFTSLFYATDVRAELERRAGGAFVQNRDRLYALSAGERGYLTGPSSRNFVDRAVTFTTKPLNSVMTVHTMIDPLIPVSQSQFYGTSVAASGRGARLLQLYTNGTGHCTFTGPQVLTAVAEIDAWVQTGTRPDPGAFSAGLGFLSGFLPPAPLQP